MLETGASDGASSVAEGVVPTASGAAAAAGATSPAPSSGSGVTEGVPAVPPPQPSRSASASTWRPRQQYRGARSLSAPAQAPQYAPDIQYHQQYQHQPYVAAPSAVNSYDAAVMSPQQFLMQAQAQLQTQVDVHAQLQAAQHMIAAMQLQQQQQQFVVPSYGIVAPNVTIPGFAILPQQGFPDAGTGTMFVTGLSPQPR